MIQFELSNTLNMQQLVGVVQKRGSNSTQKDLAELIEAFFGKNFEWKIGDMDMVFNRNLNIRK